MRPLPRAMAAVFCALLAFATPANAWAQNVPLKSLGRFEGWRDNALIGYGIVTGLAGSGDTRRNEVTRQALRNVLSRLGTVVGDEQINSRNVAVVTRQRLFARFQPFARRLAAAQYARRAAGGFERADMEQLAYEALLQAIARFDPARAIPFEAFARRRILGHISNGLAQMSESAAQYRYRQRAERDRLRSLREGQAAMENDRGALAALSELAALLALGLMAEDAGPIDPDDLASDQPSAYESLAWHEMRGKLHEAIAALPERERYIVSQHYTGGVSFQQIAAILGVSKGRVSQLHRTALLHLRERLAQFR